MSLRIRGRCDRVKVTVPVTTPLVGSDGPVIAGDLNPGDVIACVTDEWVEWLPVTSLTSTVECSGYKVVADGLPPFNMTRENKVLTVGGFRLFIDAMRLNETLKMLRVDGDPYDGCDNDMDVAAYNYMVTGNDARFDYDPREVFCSDDNVKWRVRVGVRVSPVISYLFLWSGECVSFDVKADGVMLSSGIIVR